MADVEISYNNSVIASLSDSGTEVLETNGTFMSDDITVTYTSPGGGGGGVSTVTAEIMAMSPQMVPIYFVDASGVFHQEEDSFSEELVVGSSIVVKYAGTSLPPSYFLTNLQYVANVKITSTYYLLFYKVIDNS